jgi:citrate lyase subunit beta/citryl-CoA lyase
MKTDYINNVVRRSRLIMPANAPKFTDKAFSRNADAVVLYLEDSVPVSEKAAARKLIKELIPNAGRGGSDVFVRVNNTAEMLNDDITASVWPGLGGLIIPKVESADEIGRIEQLIAKLEKERNIPEGSIVISVLIESGKGYLNLALIAGASERVDSLTLGNEDFLREMGITESADTYQGLLVARMQLLFTARACGKIPMGLLGSLANYGDPDAFEKSAVLACRHGFLGASCIHPGNVEVLNRAFSPGMEEIGRSENIIKAMNEAIAAGKASTSFEGRMIDYVHLDRAKQLLARSARIAAFEQKKKLAREGAAR